MKGLIYRFFTGGIFAFIIIIWIFQVTTINDPSLLNESDYVFKISKDVIAVMLTIIGISIAYEGLTTWKDQLSGTHKFDLSNRLLCALSELDNAYTSFSTMWIISLKNGEGENPNLNLHLPNLYWERLTNLRAAVDKFQVLQPEVLIAWEDYDPDYFNKMIILAKSYLSIAEVFLAFLKSLHKDNTWITFANSSEDDAITFHFYELCSPIILDNAKKDMDVNSTLFQINNAIWRGTYFSLMQSIKNHIN